MFERYRTIHFVGIGGIGMSGIAEVLHNLGYEVTGSDIKESETVNRLSGLGIKVFAGHKPENINGAHVVVISSAVSPENPEVAAAKERAIPVIPRAEMLAELGRLKYGVLIAGAHGKTTTTSLVAAVLSNGGLDPTVVIGGKLRSTGSNARLGQGEFIVAEADESDGSFLKLSPTIAVVTNMDREHMDFFRNMEEIKAAFASFINKVPFYGLAILCRENEFIREIIPRIHRRYITYGLTKEADVYAANISSGYMTASFDVIYKGRDMGNFSISMPGLHNVLNALASIAVGMELKLDISRIKEALSGFSGIQRRFEFKGEAGDIRIFDDYGHHPAEIRATLKAAKESLLKSETAAEDKGRLIVIFQPHRYTRTRDLMHEFSTAFADAEALFIMDIYSAGESPLDGINSETLSAAIKKNGPEDVTYIPDRRALVKSVAEKARPYDLILTLGAGDVWKTGEALLKHLNQEN